MRRVTDDRRDRSLPRLPRGMLADAVQPRRSDNAYNIQSQSTERLLAVLDSFIVRHEWHKLAHAAEVLMSLLYEDAFRPATTIGSVQVTRIDRASFAAAQARLRRAVFSGLEALLQLTAGSSLRAAGQLSTYLRRCEPLVKAGVRAMFMKEGRNVYRAAAVMALRGEKAVIKLNQLQNNSEITVRDVLDELLDALSLMSSFPSTAAPVRLSVGLAYQHLLLTTLQDSSHQLRSSTDIGFGTIQDVGVSMHRRIGGGTPGSKWKLGKRRRGFLDDESNDEDDDEEANDDPAGQTQLGIAAKRQHMEDTEALPVPVQPDTCIRMSTFQPFRFQRELWKDNEAQSLWDDAVSHIQAAIDLDPCCTNAWLQQLQLHLGHANLLHARQLLQDATRQLPLDADLCAMRIIMDRVDGVPASADACLQLLRCDPSALNAITELDQLHRHHGAPASSLIEGLMLVLDAWCGDVDVVAGIRPWQLLGDMLIQVGELQGSEGTETDTVRLLLQDRHWWEDMHFAPGYATRAVQICAASSCWTVEAELTMCQVRVAAFVLGPSHPAVEVMESLCTACKGNAALADDGNVQRCSEAVRLAITVANNMGVVGISAGTRAAAQQGASLMWPVVESDDDDPQQ